MSPDKIPDFDEGMWTKEGKWHVNVTVVAEHRINASPDALIVSIFETAVLVFQTFGVPSFSPF